jgi:hypothetical protein
LKERERERGGEKDQSSEAAKGRYDGFSKGVLLSPFRKTKRRAVNEPCREVKEEESADKRRLKKSKKNSLS